MNDIRASDSLMGMEIQAPIFSVVYNGPHQQEDELNKYLTLSLPSSFLHQTKFYQ